MASKLDQLRAMTTVVADTGDIEAVRRFRPTDCTTNPTLILKAAQSPAGVELIKEACVWGRSHHGVTSRVADRLTVSFGSELAGIVPGRVSTEVDADLSFDTAATVAKARAFIADYQSRGIERDRILIKIAATWEGIEAARILQREGIDCNLTLVFSLAQAAACADASVFLISPFVGRIHDWYVKAKNETYTSETDPGVRSVRQIYDYYKTYGMKTVVMGASFRTLGEIEALAGCDRLTIAPQWLEQLGADGRPLKRALDPAKPTTRVPARSNLDEKSFRFLMNDDAMATEKLAEGIRLFARDLGALRELVSHRLEGTVDPLAGAVLPRDGLTHLEALRTGSMIQCYDERGTIIAVERQDAILPKEVVFIDLLRPDPDETAFVERVTGLTLPSSDRMAEVEVSSRLAMQGETLQVTSPIVYRTDEIAVNTSPVGFLLSERLLVTIRFVELKSFADFIGHTPFRIADSSQAANELFLGLLETIVDRMADAMEQIGMDLDQMSRRIFQPYDERAVATKPDRAERRLTRALRTIGQNGDHTSHARDSLLGLGRLVAYVATHGCQHLAPAGRTRLDTLKQDIASLNDYESRLTDKVQFLLDSTLGFINIEQNRSFKLLTIASVIGIPPTFIVGLYGMNFKSMPEYDWAHGYAWGLFLIVVSIVVPTVWLKWRGWF